MRKYTLTDLGNKSGEVAEAAHKGPVDITSRGKRKFVLMTAEHYDHLSGRNSQKAHSIATMTAPELDELLAGLESVIADAERPDD